MMVPVIMAAMLGLVLSNLTMTESPNARAQVFDDVKRVESPEVASNLEMQIADDAKPVAERLAAQSGGAGFQPKPQSNEDQPCLTEEQVSRHRSRGNRQAMPFRSHSTQVREV